MKVAVIGPGQLGSDIIKAFGSEAMGLGHDKIQVEDMETLDVLRELRPEVVINTAAFHITAECEKMPLKAFEINAIGQRNVATVCSEIDATCVYISTDYVFDGEKQGPYTEDDCPMPVNVYGASKLCGEIFTRGIAEKYYIIRTAALFGVSGSRAKGGNFIDTVVQNIRAQETMEIVDDIVMSPTYTRDVAVALKAIIAKNLPYGIYHVVNSGQASWYGLATTIADMLGKGREFIRPVKSSYKGGVKRPKNSALAIDKIHGYGIDMRPWHSALAEYMKAKGYL